MNTNISLSSIANDPAISNEDLRTVETMESQDTPIEEVFEDNSVTGQVETTDEQSTQVQQQPNQQVEQIDARTILDHARKQIQEEFKQQRQQTQPQIQQQPQQYTQEQIDKLTGKVQVTPEMFQSILGFAPQNQAQVQSFQALVDNVAKHATTLAFINQSKAEAAYKEQISQLQNQLSPALNAYRQQQTAQLEKEFVEKYPSFKDYMPLGREVVQLLHSQGVRFNTKDEMFGAVAQKLTTLLAPVLSQTNGQVVQRQGRTPLQGQNRAKQMVSTGNGGQRGGATRSGGATTQKAGMDIFD